MKAARILVAEDDPNIRRGLIDTLESEGYAVVDASDGEQALDCHRRESFDLVILDVMMPGKSGYDVCREIRRHDASTPIIMLTAKGEEIDKVVGLELGADDYVTKPFGVRELLARIAAVLRRAQRDTQSLKEDALPDRFPFGTSEIDRKTYEGKLGSSTFNLTAREMKLIETFYRHPGEVLSRDDLLNAVWGIDYMGTTRTLDQHISQLRKKIEPDVANPSVILTVHGLGYSRSRDAATLLAGRAGLGDADPRLRAVAVRSLGVLGFAEAADQVMPLLDDPSPEVRWTAAKVLGRLAERRAVAPLIARLSDGTAEVRRQAALGLGYLGDPAARDALARAEKGDPSRSVRTAASYAWELLGKGD